MTVGLKLRDYQQEAINALPENGRVVLAMAVGLGKTVTFSKIPRKGRMLIIAHREELLKQPRKYFDCSYGIEQGKHKSNGEEVVAASVQSLIKRLDKFKPDDFDVIVVDEFHHSGAKTYKKILEYFTPRLLVGVSATPKRSDGIRLDDIFDEIVYTRDLVWGIKNGWLSDIHCLTVNVGYDLSRVHTKLGDFKKDELNREMQNTQCVNAIAQAYNKYANGQTIIFAVSVEHCNLIAEKIDNCVVITGKTKDREIILEKFKNNEINCIVNCEVLTEGTDLPNIETIIMARPTQSPVLYMQCIGRGTRKHEGKEKLTLIDIVGNTGRHSICTAATLVGVDASNVPRETLEKIEGNLFDLPDIVQTLSDCPQSWIKNVKIVELFEKNNKYDLHDVNYFKNPDDSFVIHLPNNKWYKVHPIDKISNTYATSWDGKKTKSKKAQEIFDLVFKTLIKFHKNEQAIWDKKIAKNWGKYQATDKQKSIIKKRFPDIDIQSLNKLEASQILNRIFSK